MIFYRILSSKGATLPKIIISLFLVGFSVLILTSCGSTKSLHSAPYTLIQRDTCYTCTLQYDSIYISTDKYVDRSKDAVLIQQHDVEYRYKLLHDTIKEVRIDSIPVIQEVEITKAVRHIPTFYKCCTATLITMVIVILLYLVLRLHRRLTI